MPRDQLALLGRTASGCPSRIMSGPREVLAGTQTLAYALFA